MIKFNLPFRLQSAILGGTFNPVHFAHLRLADAVASALGLDYVELTPALVPPHKDPSDLLPYSTRCALLDHAVSAHHALQVSRLESELDPPSYTWNMLHAWRRQHWGETPLFILGAEDFCQLESWYKGTELPQITSFLVVPRGEGSEQDFRQMVLHLAPETHITAFSASAGEFSFDDVLDKQAQLLAGRLAKETWALYLPLPLLDISASAVRKKWLARESIRYLTPDSVIEFLEQHAAEIRKYWACSSSF